MDFVDPAVVQVKKFTPVRSKNIAKGHSWKGRMGIPGRYIINCIMRRQQILYLGADYM
jgi:hypothetical protein